MRDSVKVAPGGAENTHWNTHKRRLCLRGNYRQIFGSWFSDLNGGKEREPSAQMWRRLGSAPCPAACANRWRQPRLLSGDARAMATRLWRRGEGTGYTRGVV